MESKRKKIKRQAEIIATLEIIIESRGRRIDEYINDIAKHKQEIKEIEDLKVPKNRN